MTRHLFSEGTGVMASLVKCVLPHEPGGLSLGQSPAFTQKAGHEAWRVGPKFGFQHILKQFTLVTLAPRDLTPS